MKNRYEPFKNKWDMKNYFFVENVNSLMDCSRCGICCTHSRVVLLEQDIQNIADGIGSTFEIVEQVFTIRVKEGWEFREKPCPFYNSGCKIYEFRPWCCKIFPFFSMINNKFPEKMLKYCKAVMWFLNHKEKLEEFKKINENFDMKAGNKVKRTKFNE